MSGNIDYTLLPKETHLAITKKKKKPHTFRAINTHSEIFSEHQFFKWASKKSYILKKC